MSGVGYDLAISITSLAVETGTAALSSASGDLEDLSLSSGSLSRAAVASDIAQKLAAHCDTQVAASGCNSSVSAELSPSQGGQPVGASFTLRWAVSGDSPAASTDLISVFSSPREIELELRRSGFPVEVPFLRVDLVDSKNLPFMRQWVVTIDPSFSSATLENLLLAVEASESDGGVDSPVIMQTRILPSTSGPIIGTGSLMLGNLTASIDAMQSASEVRSILADLWNAEGLQVDNDDIVVVKQGRSLAGTAVRNAPFTQQGGDAAWVILDCSPLESCELSREETMLAIPAVRYLVWNIAGEALLPTPAVAGASLRSYSLPVESTAAPENAVELHVLSG